MRAKIRRPGRIYFLSFNEESLYFRKEIDMFGVIMIGIVMIGFWSLYSQIIGFPTSSPWKEEHSEESKEIVKVEEAS